MTYRTRIYYTEAQKDEMWERWFRGESLNAIGRLFDRHHSSISSAIRSTHGFRPPKRKRSRLALTLKEREEISRGLVAGLSMRTIASQLGRAPSTISREVQRNGDLAVYRASTADQATWDRAHRPKPCKLVLSRQLRRLVERKLKKYWSPYQITGWLKRSYAGDETMQVSHETIYKTLFIQTRGALKKELLQHLRRTRVMRRSRRYTQKSPKDDRIMDKVSIRERPATVADRAVPGHWEGDLLMGGNHSQIATLVERHTRYVMLARVKSKDTETVVNALISQAYKLPRELYKSLTWDRGKEMAEHKRLSLDTHIKVYFCDPYSPWQRGSNENTNGLLRQYFPKGMDLSKVSQNKLNAVARSLNERPRKTLNFETPAERFAQCVASIG